MVLKKSKIWLIATVAIGLFGGLLSLPALLSKSQQTLIKGRVVSAKTKVPVSEVMVSVESILSEEESHGSFVRTDSDGGFVADVHGDKVIIRAWKPRYLMNGLDIESATTILSSQPINIELREIEYPNLAIVHDDYLRVKSNLAYSLSRGELVEKTSPEADITINFNPHDKASVIIESLGEGGIIYQAETETLNSVTALEAPAEGYQRQVVKKFLPHSSEGWFLFVRARDGKHYSKLALGINTILQPDGDFYVSLDEATRFACNYQPDGSRNLGGNPTKTSFPFSEFGFDVNSLNR